MERYVPVPGGRLFVCDEGAGPPVVLIHAAVADLRSWDAVAPALVDEGYRVIRYDARGYGRSATDDVEFDLHEDLVAVLGALSVERAALVGNSLGARTALQAVIAAPDRVAAVVAIAPGLAAFDGERTPAEQALWDEGDRLEAAPELDVDAYVDLLVRVWADGPGQPPDRLDPAIREAVRSMTRPVFEPEHHRGRRKPFEPPIEERLGEIRCPLLAVVGDLDDTTCRRTTKAIAEAVPGARYEVLTGVAHMVSMEAPATLASLTVEFLETFAAW